jgi:hypothetical protein
MGAIHLRDQILQTYLLGSKEGSKWYMKLFKRLLNNFMIYWFMPNNKGTDPLKFRLLLIEGLIENQSSAVPHPVYGCPSTEPSPKRLTGRHILE